MRLPHKNSLGGPLAGLYNNNRRKPLVSRLFVQLCGAANLANTHFSSHAGELRVRDGNSSHGRRIRARRGSCFFGIFSAGNGQTPFDRSILRINEMALLRSAIICRFLLHSSIVTGRICRCSSGYSGASCDPCQPCTLKASHDCVNCSMGFASSWAANQSVLSCPNKCDSGNR